MNYHHHDAYSEAYEVALTSIVLHEGHTFKIEALHDMKKLDENEFSTNVYVRRRVKVQPTFPDDIFGSEIFVWSLIVEFPFTRRDTAEGAIAQALGFLKDHYKK
jgi:hypothetical protein